MPARSFVPLKRLLPTRALWQQSLAAYTLALLAVGAAVIIQQESAPFLDGPPSTPFILAVLLIAVAAGVGPAVTAAVILWAVYAIWFDPPIGTLQFDGGFAIHTAMYALVTAFGIWLTWRFRYMEARLERATADRVETEQRFAILANQAPVYMSMRDQHGRLVWVNETALRFLGRDYDAMLGDGWLTHVHPEDVARVQTEWNKAGPQAVQMEYRVRAADGAYHWVWQNAVPRHDSSGRFLGHISVLTDITLMHHARQELAEYAQSKHDFLRVMSHELRTPLNVIIGYAELLETGIDTPVNGETLPQVITRSAYDLLRMIERVLEFQDIQQGVITIQREKVTVREVVDHVVGQVQPVAAKRGLDVLVSLVRAPETLYTDRHKVETILGELLANAVKFTRDGAVMVKVIGTVTQVEFHVHDTGVGMNTQQSTMSFEPFFQVRQSMVREVGGMGLGLTRAHGLAQALGGDIVVQSTPLRGSTFVLRLPVGPQTVP